MNVLTHKYNRNTRKYDIPLQFTLTEEMIEEDGEKLIDIRYGYESHFGNLCHETDGPYAGRSVIDGGAYRIFHQTTPKAGDRIKMTTGNEEVLLVVGLCEGFIRYKNELKTEDGAHFGYLQWEDYYKD